MIVPFWSWNLSDTTHVSSHTKFQLVWAINTAFTRGGLNQPPPSLKCVAGTPSLLGLRIYVNQPCPKCGSASRSRGFQPGEGPGRHLLHNCENFADGSFAALISSVSCWVTDWVHVLMIPTVTESSPGPGGVMTVELIPIKTSAAAS